MSSPRFLTPDSAGVDVDRKHHIRTVIDEPAEQRIREPLAAHLADVGAIEAHVALPAPWLALRARWADFTLTARPCRDALVRALLDGGGDPASLFAQALAEESATNGDRAEVLQHVSAGVCGALTRVYEPVARKFYATIAHKFNDIATGGDEHRLEEMALALTAAARLAGADQDVARAATNRLTLALCVDPRDAHLRRVSEAFEIDHAGNRWQRVTQLGARIRAATNPLTPYPTLPPLIRCVDRERRLTWHDPLDGTLPTGWRPALDGWEGDPFPAMTM